MKRWTNVLIVSTIPEYQNETLSNYVLTPTIMT